MAIRIKLKTARPKITTEGILAALGIAVAVAYLIAPQFVAGILWDAVNAAVTFWAVS
jgi:hypothetical protein